MKEFRKSVIIQQRQRQKHSGTFFPGTVYMLVTSGKENAGRADSVCR